MFKRKSLLVLMLVMCFLLVSCENILSTETSQTETNNGQKTELIINYQRPDGNYEGWNLWIWNKNKDGSAHQFNGETDFGVQYRTQYDFTDVEEIGFIVKLNEWESKDTDGDRFMDTSRVKDGVLEIFVVSGEEEFTYSHDGVAELAASKLTGATVSEINAITFEVNNADALKDALSATKVFKNDKEVVVASAEEIGKTTGKLILAEPIEFNATYKIKPENLNERVAVLSSELFESESFKPYIYSGDDLGFTYTKEKTIFKLWAPFASEVILNTYEESDGNFISKNNDQMQNVGNGVWSIVKDGDLNGTYYNYTVTNQGKTSTVYDPYAVAAGVNGDHSMVVDLSTTNPEGWDKDTYFRPIDKTIPQTDAVIYELHVRDMSVNPNSGIENKGKFLAFTELGTKSPEGALTGLSHIKELGVNYIHLLPVFDFASINEINPEGKFNWGYDPYNYNLPEGSFSSNPYDGAVRIKEFKQMVQSIHQQGMGVVMDVVYNHTSQSSDSYLNLVAPGYYYRMDAKGGFSNGSGCGNELASERAMVRKLFVDSIVHWAKEYHVDGFRFDLMALIDADTMNLIRAELDKINPNIIIYGEGWTGGGTTLPEDKQSLKRNVKKLFDERIAAFSDDIRDGMKGNVFDGLDTGFISGNGKNADAVKYGIAASTRDQGSITAWAKSPTQTVTYNSAHDNYTLFDKFQYSVPKATEEELIAMNKMAAVITITSQGITFLHAGEEMLRTKVKDDGTFEHNSYQSPDSVNMLDWSRKTTYNDVFKYYQGLIDLRAKHPAFRMSTKEDIDNNLAFLETDENVIAYTISNNANGDSVKTFVVAFNPLDTPIEINLPGGVSSWDVYVNGERASADSFDKIEGNVMKVPAMTSMVIGK